MPLSSVQEILFILELMQIMQGKFSPKLEFLNVSDIFAQSSKTVAIVNEPANPEIPRRKTDANSGHYHIAACDE